MVERRLRSRSWRKIPRKVPGGAIKIQYKKPKPKAAHCANCGAALKGVPRELPLRMRNLAKTKKRPQRPYGGMLCTKCMRQKILDSVHE